MTERDRLRGNSLGEPCEEKRDLENPFRFPVKPGQKRSPLHPSALNMEDLHVGLEVQCYHKGHPREPVLTIVSEPFREEFGSIHLWAVEVRYIDSVRNKSAHAVMPLPDMGIAPYEGDRGPFWNPSNYTVAANS